MRLAEVFLGFDGEVNGFGQGCPSLFVRLAGCNLRCSYCDTKQFNSQKTGTEMPVEEVFKKIKAFSFAFYNNAKMKKVTITGGEPLLQYFQFWELVKLLDADDWYISVETNGSMIHHAPDGVKRSPLIDCFVVDYKLLSSGVMQHMMPLDSFGSLIHCDFIKFVIADDNDLNTAFDLQKRIQSETECNAKFAYSPAWGTYDVSILGHNLLSAGGEVLGNAVLNYQLHKLWKDEKTSKVQE